MIQFTRGKGKVHTDFGLDDIYKFYKKNLSNPINKELFRKVCKEYNQEMLRKVVYDGHDFSMGARIGYIRIAKFNNAPKLNDKGEIHNKFAVDWIETKKRWQELYSDKTIEDIRGLKNKPLVYHLNEHTDNWIMKWHWDKITCNVPNQSAYRFEPNRTIKREAAKAWKTIPGMKDNYYE
jgi:hypothetical protein